MQAADLLTAAPTIIRRRMLATRARTYAAANRITQLLLVYAVRVSSVYTPPSGTGVGATSRGGWPLVQLRGFRGMQGSPERTITHPLNECCTSFDPNTKPLPHRGVCGGSSHSTTRLVKNNGWFCGSNKINKLPHRLFKGPLTCISGHRLPQTLRARPFIKTSGTAYLFVIGCSSHLGPLPASQPLGDPILRVGGPPHAVEHRPDKEDP
eukprot:9301112-Pyramimonas_sp.AAC.1